jgi:hypothetical protein
MAMLQLRDLELSATEAVRPVKVHVALGKAQIGRTGHADPRPTGRIELLDNRLHVARGLIRWDVAPHGRDRDNFHQRVEQGQAEGHCVVDPLDFQDTALGLEKQFKEFVDAWDYGKITTRDIENAILELFEVRSIKIIQD